MSRPQGWEPSQNTLWLMQSLGVTLQMINAAAAVAVGNAAASVVLSAIVAGYQMYVQKLGNDSVSPKQAEVVRLLNEETKPK